MTAALWLWIGCMVLVLGGAAVQVAVGAGLSVVSGSLMLLWLGPLTGVPILLGLNLLVSVIATACGARGIRWSDVVLASGATLAGCAVASLFPPLPVAALKLMTAFMLAVIALPRPLAPGRLPSAASAGTGIALAGLVTGALTVWTAMPGPVTPVAFTRAGRSGPEIRQAMQPISIVGYGAAFAWVGMPRTGAIGSGMLTGLVAAALLGIVLGFRLRPRVDAAQVVLMIRIVAGLAAVLLLVSVLR